MNSKNVRLIFLFFSIIQYFPSFANTNSRQVCFGDVEIAGCNPPARSIASDPVADDLSAGTVDPNYSPEHNNSVRVRLILPGGSEISDKPPTILNGESFGANPAPGSGGGFGTSTTSPARGASTSPRGQQTPNASRTNNTNGQPNNADPQQQGQTTDNLNAVCAELRRECDEAREGAGRECDADSGSSSAGSAGRSSMSQIGQQVDQMSQASGTAGVEMCAAMSKVSAVANSAVAGLTFMCGQKQSTCVDKCTELTRKIDANQCTENPGIVLSASTRENNRAAAAQNRSECNRMSARASESSAALNRTAQNLLTQSQRCIEQQYSGGLDAFCLANPTSAACHAYAANDCSNAQTAASNLTCVCAINSNDPRCNANIARLNTGGGIDTSGLGGSTKVNSELGSDGLNFGDESSISGGPANTNPANKVGGKENIRGLEEGGGFPGGSGAGGGYAGGGDISDRTKIYRGGLGRGGSGGGAWGSGNNAGQQGQGAAGYGTQAGANNIDLRQFLPGGTQDASRGLATVIGPDGVSGAHSNNFSKIKNRYYDQYSRRNFITSSTP